MSTYLIINLLVIIIPFIFSFEKKVSFYKSWYALFPAIILTAIPFIVWDIQFTKAGIWHFNSLHLSGMELFYLPIEEWLFFFAIPYACVFTYEALKYYISKDYLGDLNIDRYISLILIIILLTVAIVYSDRLYTFIAFIAASVILIFVHFIFKAPFMGRFYLTWAILLIPFFLTNGLLTGIIIHEQVVSYNDAQNLGIRIFTIPIEDSVYGMMLILLNVSFYEFFKKIKNKVQ